LRLHVARTCVAIATLAFATIGLAPAGPAGAQAAATFISKCAASHMAMDDPIVYPGQPGLSHMHVFFGNTTTNAYSTLSNLLGQPTTCHSSLDTAAYWIPALYQNGVLVNPNPMRAYYRIKVRHPSATVRPFPAGLKMIAGNAHATGPTGVALWSCNTGTFFNMPPTCPPGQPLNLRINFPDCWDGVHLDSADHQSHMAYSNKGTCPASHPVALPFLQYNVNYKTVGGAGVTLASGAAYTAHADFFNSWNQSALTQFVNNCLNYPQFCGIV
jgi:hypothetical protein